MSDTDVAFIDVASDVASIVEPSEIARSDSWGRESASIARSLSTASASSPLLTKELLSAKRLLGVATASPTGGSAKLRAKPASSALTVLVQLNKVTRKLIENRSGDFSIVQSEDRAYLGDRCSAGK